MDKWGRNARDIIFSSGDNFCETRLGKEFFDGERAFAFDAREVIEALPDVTVFASA